MTKSFKTTVFVLSFFIHFFAQAQQDSILLIETTFTVKNNKSETYYFGLSKGDVFCFSIDVTDGAIKGVEFCSYPDNTIFKQNYVGAIKNKTIQIAYTGVYYFRFYQSGFLAGRRHCTFKAHRIPSVESTIAFNTTVYWHEKPDTIWYYEDEEYITHTDTLVNPLTDQIIKLKKKGKSDRSYITFSCPDTNSFYAIWIGTGKEALEQFKNYEKQMLANYPHVGKYGLLADIAMRGSFSFATPPLCRAVSYWLLDNTTDLNTFNSDSLNLIPEKHSSCMNYLYFENTFPTNRYLCLHNENKKTLWVHVKITSIKIIKHYGTRKVKKYRIETVQEPYLRN